MKRIQFYLEKYVGRRPNMIIALALFVSLLITSCSTDNPEADLVIKSATIWTGNSEQPFLESMAIVGDTILAVGTNDEIELFRGANTELVDLSGQFVTPGFIDSHVHFVDGGFSLSSVQLRDADTPTEFITRIAEYISTQPDGTWITGGTWDGSNWESLPSRHWIDSISPNHPVFVGRLDGHMSLANSLALELAGVNRDAEDVDGGVIERDSNGELTGIFKDNAVTLISSKIPPASEDQIDHAIDQAMHHFAANGVTSVHNVWYPSDSEGHVEGFVRAAKEGRLITRIFSLGSLEEWERRKNEVLNQDWDPKWLKINGLKGVFDGALGSHTAAFTAPFTDDPTDSGLFMMPKSSLYDWVSAGDSEELQIAIHAIGDRAIDELLNTYSQIGDEKGKKDRRWRVEHAQHIDPADFDRFAELGVVASVQPYHAIDDGRWAEKVIGPERIKTTYAFRSLMDAGAIVAFGSDWTVAPASPLLGIYAAVTRRTIDDKNPDGWVPEQKVTVEQAMDAYTKNGAYASFEEDIKGTLEPGKLADFVVLDQDITTVHPIDIKEVRVLMTFVGGKLVYNRDSDGDNVNEL